MKRLALLAFAGLLTTAVPLGAQSGFGVLGGLTSSKVSVEGGGATLTFESRTGFAAGLSLIRPIGGGLDLELDGLYVQKGMSISEQAADASLNLAYIEVPVLLRYGIGYNSSMRPFLLGGASLAFKAGCSVSGEEGGVSVDLDCDELLGAEQESFDLGITYGAGVQFNRLSIQARYTLGLMNIGDDEDVTSKNRTWYLLAGISF